MDSSDSEHVGILEQDSVTVSELSDPQEDKQVLWKSIEAYVH